MPRMNPVDASGRQGIGRPKIVAGPAQGRVQGR